VRCRCLARGAEMRNVLKFPRQRGHPCQEGVIYNAISADGEARFPLSALAFFRRAHPVIMQKGSCAAFKFYFRRCLAQRAHHPPSASLVRARGDISKIMGPVSGICDENRREDSECERGREKGRRRKMGFSKERCRLRLFRIRH
jgi:hypothetical protein